MARRPKPWRRKGRGWFVIINGKQVPLGQQKKAAYTKFYELMSKAKESQSESLQMLALLDDFLEWNRKNRAAATYESYRQQLQSLVDFLPEGFVVDDLRPHHIQKWLDAHLRTRDGRASQATARPSIRRRPSRTTNSNFTTNLYSIRQPMKSTVLRR